MGAKSQSLSSSIGVDAQLTDRALRALLKHHESSSSDQQLLGNDLDVQVQFTLARIPTNPSPKPIRIEIPHPLVKVASTADGDGNDEDDNLQDVEVCLIVKEESKPWVQEMVTRFPTELKCIKKVLGLQSLRTKHKSFTQRRELLARFDVFLADDRILPMLTKALGGKFFEKKKQPIPIKLTRKEALPFAVQKCLSSTFMYLSAGTCVTVKAGSTGMPSSKLLSNIESICSSVPMKVPRKWSNMRSISIKTSASVALPIYNKTPEELEQIMKLAKEEKSSTEKEEEVEHGADKKKKRKMAANTPLAKALKKQKAAEEAGEEEKTEESTEKVKKSSKKKRKESVDSQDGEQKVVAKPPKSSKKKRKEDSHHAKEEVVKSSKKEAKTPKSSKKRKESIDSHEADEAVKAVKKKKDAMTPKSAKKKDDSASAKDANFIPSKKFIGAKKGYAFRKSNLGCGYYKDVLPLVDKAFLASLSKKGGRGAGGGRKSMGTGMKKKKGGRSRRSY